MAQVHIWWCQTDRLSKTDSFERLSAQVLDNGEKVAILVCAVVGMQLWRG